jgi:competence protein ComEC
LISTFYLVGLVIWQWPDAYSHLVVCDIGQGDAILITSRFTQVLIDGGPDDQVLKCLGEYMPFWDRTLELVVATHGDKDHIGGLPAVLKSYEVSQLLQSDRHKESADFHDFQALVSSKKGQGMVVKTASVGQAFSLEKTSKLKILSPLAETQLSAVEGAEHLKEKNYNDASIVLLWQVGRVKTLLTGDLESPGESALIARRVLLDIDILKVGHHGSKTSTTLAFLSQTRPEIALISCGKNNQYGHPHEQTLRNLEQVGVKILRTDQEGSLEIVIDGEKYWKKEKKSRLLVKT